MMQLMIGGSGSGKSAYAEKTLVSLAGGTGMKKYYLAAMQDDSPEGQKKVERHKRLRDGKGFFTIEQPVDIHQALERMEAGKRAAILECIPNLAANEMFAGGENRAGEAVAEKLLKDIRMLYEGLEHLVIVSGNVFEDGAVYDDAVLEYIRAMGRLHRELVILADQAVELVAGIPVWIRRKKGD